MFEHTDGVISHEVINEEYCFDIAYKGDYQLKLRLDDKEKTNYLKSEDKKFYGLEVGTQYVVEVLEDEEAESKIEKKTYTAAPTSEKKMTAKDLLTQELKNMSADELREAGDKYKEIIEARELEDCLYN